MKKIISLVALMALAFPASAEDVDVSFSGDFRVRGQYDIVQSFDDAADDRNGNDWSSQFRIGSAWNAGEEISGQISFLANAHWGGDTDSREVAENASNFDVYELYATWLLSDTTKIRVGRGVYTLADGTIVSENFFEDLPFSFDGIIYTHEMDWARLDAFFARLENDGANSVAAAADNRTHADTIGLNLDLKFLPDAFSMANVHVLQVNKDATTHAPADIDYLRYGLTLAGDVGAVDFRGTYAAYSGDISIPTTTSEGDYSGSMYDLELGFNMRDLMGARFHVLLHSDSGDEDGNVTATAAPPASDDNDRYDGFFYNRHDNAGLMDVIRWGNSTYTQLGISFEPQDDLVFDIRYIMFEKTESKDTVQHELGAVALGTGDDVGDEIDFSVTHKYENGLEIQARYSMFSPGNAFAGDDDYSQFFLQASLEF